MIALLFSLAASSDETAASYANLVESSSFIDGYFPPELLYIFKVLS